MTRAGALVVNRLTPFQIANQTQAHIDDPGFFLPNKNGFVTGPARAAAPAAHAQYFGGGVLAHADVTPMYVGDYFNTAAGKADVTHNDAFIADLVKNPDYNSIWHQYGVDTATSEASHVIPGTFQSGDSITQAQLEDFLKAAIANGTVKPGTQSIYNFVLPPGAILTMNDGTTSDQGLGGFHSSIHLADGTEVFYSANAYSLGDNGIDFTNGNAQDNISITESHELTEAVTDPHVQDAIDGNDYGKLGWIDLNGGEIGDIAVNDAPPGTPLSEMFGRMDGYAVQNIWSEVDKTNEIKAKHPGPVLPLPKPASPPNGEGISRGVAA